MPDGPVLAQRSGKVADVLHGRRLSLLQRRLRGRDSGAQVAGDVAKYPRVADGRPSDHDGIAARLREHACGIFGTPDVPISDDWDAYRLLDVCDPAPIRLAVETLPGGPSMQRESSRAEALKLSCERNRCEV